MQEIEWKRSIPVTKEVDVCVVGGGPAGIAAAVTAAAWEQKCFWQRNSSALVEQLPYRVCQPLCAFRMESIFWQEA